MEPRWLGFLKSLTMMGTTPWSCLTLWPPTPPPPPLPPPLLPPSSQPTNQPGYVYTFPDDIFLAVSNPLCMSPRQWGVDSPLSLPRCGQTSCDGWQGPDRTFPPPPRPPSHPLALSVLDSRALCANCVCLKRQQSRGLRQRRWGCRLWGRRRQVGLAGVFHH